MPSYKPQRFHLRAPNRRQTGKKINSRPKKMPRSPRFYLVLLKMQTSAVTRDILGATRKKSPSVFQQGAFLQGCPQEPAGSARSEEEAKPQCVCWLQCFLWTPTPGPFEGDKAHATQSTALLDAGVLGGKADRKEPRAARLMVEAERLSGAPSAGLGSKGKGWLEPSKLL